MRFERPLTVYMRNLRPLTFQVCITETIQPCEALKLDYASKNEIEGLIKEAHGKDFVHTTCQRMQRMQICEMEDLLFLKRLRY